MGLVNCQKCQLPIKDEFWVLIKDLDGTEHYSHESCLNCKGCGETLCEKAWKHSGDVYCEKDYSTKYNEKNTQTCHICLGTFKFGELAVQLSDEVLIHDECFACTVCHKALKSDATLSYNPKTFYPYCLEHQYFESNLEASPEEIKVEEPSIEIKKEENNEDSEDDDESKSSKKRTPRTKFTEAQTNLLMTVFQTSPRPTRLKREQLAKETGLPNRCIQIWFQNRRSKEKRQSSKRFMSSNPAMAWYPYQSYGPAPMVTPMLGHLAAPHMMNAQGTVLTTLPPHMSPPNSALYPTPPPSEELKISPNEVKNLEAGLYFPQQAQNFEPTQCFEIQPPSFETAAMQASYPSPTYSSNSETVEISNLGLDLI